MSFTRTALPMLVVLAFADCAPAPASDSPGRGSSPAPGAVDVFTGNDKTFVGSPQAVAIGFDGIVYVADSAPGRIIAFDRDGSPQEFQTPPNRAFLPTDVAVNAFFIYAIDEPGRQLLRFDRAGTYRDVLIDFQTLADVRRVSPYGLDVEESGRMAVTDIENHQILIIDTFLQIELVFGNYGAYPGQFDTPQGVAFAPDGRLIVADTGNRRIAVFSAGGSFVRQFPEEDGGLPFVSPRRVAVDDSNYYVADPGAGKVFVLDMTGQIVRTFGPDTGFEPRDVAISSSGLVFIPDAASNGLHIYKGK